MREQQAVVCCAATDVDLLVLLLPAIAAMEGLPCLPGFNFSDASVSSNNRLCERTVVHLYDTLFLTLCRNGDIM